jgi:hypothetical protein
LIVLSHFLYFVQVHKMVSRKFAWAAGLFLSVLAAQDPDFASKSNAGAINLGKASAKNEDTNASPVTSGGTQIANSDKTNQDNSRDRAKEFGQSQSKSDETQSNQAQSNQADNTSLQDADSSTLSPTAIQTGSFFDGQQAVGADNGQAASRTSMNNFMNECVGQTLTNGLQIVDGSCNGISE